ncbi:hypothetical protein Tco_0412657 [Tanacetum coccineum]
MDDSNITMEEYIRLKEEKAQKHGKVFNWETAKYGKIWYDKNVHNLKYVETEFPAIVFNDTLMSEPTVSSLNNEIDFRISFDESDDEDYTVIFDKNSFSYKKNSTNDLKTDSKNDNEKVMPSLHHLSLRFSKPMDMTYRLSGHYPVFIFSTVDIFNTGINTAYPGEPSKRNDLVDCIFFRILCVLFMLGFRLAFAHRFLLINAT